MAKFIDAGTFTPGTDTVEVHGSFNGWGATTLVQSGSSSVYTNTVEDTVDANGGVATYKFVIDGSNWESLPTGNNRGAKLPTTSGASLILPTAFFNDAGDAVTYSVTFQVDVSQQIQLGNFLPDSSFVEVRGTFNSWSGDTFTLNYDPTILVTNQFGLVSSNVYTGTFDVTTSPGASQEFKYVLQPGSMWDSPAATNTLSGQGGGNRFFLNTNQILPVVSYSDSPYAPIAGLIFNVDMSTVILQDLTFDPTSVTINGDFNGWSTGIEMTNNPSAANPNIFTSTSIISNGVGSTIQYQFRYQTSNGTKVYDHYNGVNGGSGNRSYTVPNVTFTNVPAVYFNDAQLNDFLPSDTPVLFQVNMTGAVGTDSHAFDPSADDVYVNGAFISWYTWSTLDSPVAALMDYQLYPAGNGLYTNIITIPAGTAIGFEYKYGIDIGRLGGPIDDESNYSTNHFRVVRSTKFDPYPMPVDTFGTMTQEPYFNSSATDGGRLQISPPTNNTVSVTWLGRPGARLQTRTNLFVGSWTTISSTDGTNWTSGFNSTNGFVSQTNYPVSNTPLFFRLIKP